MTTNITRTRVRRWLILGFTSALLFGIGLAVSHLLSLSPVSLAGDLPKTVTSSPCTTAPTIDGVLGEGEWKEATVIKFDMPMFQLKPPAEKEKRACELRVMNSANVLYVALRAPNAAEHKSLQPLEIDLASLAFSQGKEAARGDDRKVLAIGFYVDKHVVQPGKDENDPQQDGRGAVAYNQGFYTFEWAVPLDSKDPNDLRARPGDEFRFNIAFFDHFTTDLKDTQAGGLFGAGLDHPTNWGTLRLADKAKDDDGAAFRGPAWLDAAIGRPDKPPANRLRVTGGSLLTGQSAPIGKAELAYSYPDTNGAQTQAKAKLYLPAAVQKGGKLPLLYNAGYELDDFTAAGWVERGYAVATPSGLDRLPLARAVNPDIALLHIVRALPFVDDARVVVAGTSAGGWAAFLLAAETFPLAGVAPDVAPMNWGYNGAYLLNQKERLTPKVGALYGIRPLIEPVLKVYGEDMNDQTWFRHSPLAHLATITCPVSTFWTTADVLVPMNQIGDRWVQPFDAKEFPPGVTMDPDKLTTSKEARLRLTDALSEQTYEVFVVPMPAGAVKRSVSQAADQRKVIELPVSAKKQWSITILDEGPPEPQVDHLKYNLRWTRDEFLRQTVTGRIPPNQLTATKLERLMDRYAGREWLPTPLKQLDQPESEKADVMRGLRTYVTASAENARTFADLYGKLPADRRRLPSEIVKQLTRGK
ncbi:MAG: hypothetical protein ACREEM_10700 [Blastocatellia bacterium]